MKSITSMIRLFRRNGDFRHPLKWAMPCTFGGNDVCKQVFSNLYLPFVWLQEGVGEYKNSYMKDYRYEQQIWINRAKNILEERNES